LKTGNTTDKRNVWKDAMYVSLPMLSETYNNLSYPNKNFPANIPSDVKVRIRIARTYRTYATSVVLRNNQPIAENVQYWVASTPVTYNGSTYSNVGDSFTGVAGVTAFTGAGTVTSTAPVNGFNPMYTFGTGDLANSTYNTDAAKKAMEHVNIVPNPYYAFSSYEVNQLDNRVKVTNLPPKCTVSIFTMSGTLIRRYIRDVASDNSSGEVYNPAKANPETSIDWDLKNHKGIPIASGMYLIHVEAPGIGEKTLKWFGMIRPIDLDTF